MKTLFFFLPFFLLAACAGRQECDTDASLGAIAIPVADQQTNCPNPIVQYENPERIPLRNFVLGEMGGLRGKTVLDIGAGPGFFAFEMAKTADKVIATELDELFIDYMETKSAQMGLTNFQVRWADEHQNEFGGYQVDYALMVYVFHYLNNPKEFLSRLKKVLKPGSKLFIVNADQISNVIIEDYLGAAGFTGFHKSSFIIPATGACGPQEVVLIAATLSPAN